MRVIHLGFVKNLTMKSMVFLFKLLLDVATAIPWWIICQFSVVLPAFLCCEEFPYAILALVIYKSSLIGNFQALFHMSSVKKPLKRSPTHHGWFWWWFPSWILIVPSAFGHRSTGHQAAAEWSHLQSAAFSVVKPQFSHVLKLKKT